MPVFLDLGEIPPKKAFSLSKGDWKPPPAITKVKINWHLMMPANGRQTLETMVIRNGHWRYRALPPNNSQRMYVAVLYTVLCNHFVILCSDGKIFSVLSRDAVGISVWNLASGEYATAFICLFL